MGGLPPASGHCVAQGARGLGETVGQAVPIGHGRTVDQEAPKKPLRPQEPC